jgi:hypothetical protein
VKEMRVGKGTGKSKGKGKAMEKPGKPRTREERRRCRMEFRRRNLPKAQRIKARREQMGFSMAQVANAARIPLGTWKGYEAGWSRIPSHRLDAVASALGCSIEWIVTGRGEVAVRDGAA